MRISSLNRFITLPEKETDAKVVLSKLDAKAVLSKLDAKAVLSSFSSSQEEGNEDSPYVTFNS